MSKAPKAPKAFKPRHFKDADAAVAYVAEIYDTQTAYLRAAYAAFATGDWDPAGQVRGFYPYVLIQTREARRQDIRMSYGFAPKPGIYSATLTRPDIFCEYYRQQLALLLQNHQDSQIEVGQSHVPIPVDFALGEDFTLEHTLKHKQIGALSRIFDLPSLDTIDDEIANGFTQAQPGDPAPLSLFTAPRVDISLQRLRHYTGTSGEHFQNFVIFTNYQFYIEGFIQHAERLMAATQDPDILRESREYVEFVKPGNEIWLNANLADNAQDYQAPHQALNRDPQMPAYHLKRADGCGITMINIGVGPSNAKTITDHVAVLRPHAWLMLGHCAGLRNSQQLGDYVLAHGYLREDNILDDIVPLNIPVPALSEIQTALEQSVAKVTESEGYDIKKVMRTGTVATTDDRNWELDIAKRYKRRLSQSRAIAMDMESGTIAANGLRFRVPYGTLLCVSDKPLHGKLKLPGMARDFYNDRVDQHLKIGLMTMSLLRELDPRRLHSRKLRSFDEVPFQ